MVYSNSSEEHKYLAAIRREKHSFERLIKERGVSFYVDDKRCLEIQANIQSMLITLVEDRRESNDTIIKTISSRLAGGRRELNKEPSRVCRLFFVHSNGIS